MKLAASLFLFAFASVDADSNSTSLWSHRNRRRRLSLHDSSCTLYKEHMTFEPTPEHPLGWHQDKWICEFSREDSVRIGAAAAARWDAIDLDESSSQLAGALEDARSGESVLTMSQAILDQDEGKLYFPASASFHVDNDIPTIAGSSAVGAVTPPKSLGTLDALVVRVVDKNKVGPPSGVDKLKDDFFLDDACLKTQMEACSYGKLTIHAFDGTMPSGYRVRGGVVEVQLDRYDIHRTKEENTEENGTQGGILDNTDNAATNLLGNGYMDKIDLVLFCFPEGKGSIDGIAHATQNGKVSRYKGDFCTRTQAQMHEVGHNLNLAHSGSDPAKDEGFKEYGDTSGSMGSAFGGDDTKVCYNPAKSFQLRWYEDQTKTIKPVNLPGGMQEFILNGVADYGENKDALVVLRLHQTSLAPDFYIGFNRATGINKDTEEDRDMVTIVRAGSGDPFKSSQSWKVASLYAGKSYTLKDFNGDRDIMVSFVALLDGNAKIQVIDTNNYVPPPPPTCYDVIVQVTTDKYPGDTQWNFRDPETHAIVAESPPKYTEKHKTYSQKVCLPMGPKPKIYIFTMFDGYGDGLGSGEPDGSYDVFDDQDVSLTPGDKTGKFKSRPYDIMVPKDPNPSPPDRDHPAPPPTASPTAKPDCRTYTIEVKTDNYPGDTRWKILRDKFDVAFAKDSFEGKHKIYTDDVCLTAGNQYEFVFEDTYGDGLLNDAYYKVLDPNGEVVIEHDNHGKFKVKNHIIDVALAGPDGPSPPKAPTPKPSKAPTPNSPVCEDGAKTKFSFKGKGKKRSCKFLAKRKKCGKKIAGGEYDGKTVADVCQKSCNKCN